MELSQHRLKEIGDFPALELKYGRDVVGSLKDRLFLALGKLAAGRHYDLTRDRDGNIRPDSELEILVKVCCLWIYDHPNYELSNDFTKIRKIYELR